MENIVKQEVIESEETLLVVMTKDEFGRQRSYVGHKKISERGSIWAPYKVGDSTEFSRSSCIGSMGKYQKEYAKELSEEKEIPFVLVEGEFPRGCGMTIWQPRLTIAPKAKTVEEFIDNFYEFMPYDPGLEVKATGKLKLDSKDFAKLRVYDFSKSYFDVKTMSEMPCFRQPAFRDYESTFEALINGYIAKEGTPIFFEANLEKSKEMSLK